MSDPTLTTETDGEIERRLRQEIAKSGGSRMPIRLRVPGPYEIEALLRLLDRERGRHA